jgi:hypothetical protein
MSVLTPSRIVVGEIWTRGRHIERTCFVLGAVLIGAGIFHLAG